MSPMLKTPQLYANALRDQAMADFECADDLIQAEAGRFDAAISKLQQALEKLLKGYLLYELPNSYQPIAPHTVIADWESKKGPQSKKLSPILNSLTTRGKLKELESLAPKGIGGISLDPESPETIGSIARNTEYPFNEPGKCPSYPAADFTGEEAVEYRKAVKSLLTALSSAPPYQFTARIEEFLDKRPRKYHSAKGKAHA